MKENYEFIKGLFRDQNNIAFAEVIRDGRKEYHPVFGEEIKGLIGQDRFLKDGTAPSKFEIEKAQACLAALAQHENQRKKVFVRVAEIAGGIELDLNDAEGKTVVITQDGWKVGPAGSAFARSASSRALVQPDAGGSWELFKKHFRTDTDQDVQLIVGFMLSCYRPNGPYPLLVLQGEQGSAKSTTARMIKMLVDPAIGATRGLIRKEHDIYLAAKNNHLVSFDNVSLIKNDLSDVFCRIATGGAFSTRTLYTNDGETLFELAKPILLNGIEFGVRPDLASRSIVLELPAIPDNERKTQEEVMAVFETDLPRMLGVLLDGVASALKNKHQTILERMPRLADVALWCAAAEEGLGWPSGTFIKALEENQSNSSLNGLADDPVAIALRAFLVDWPSGQWKGPAQELLAHLNRYQDQFERPRKWPSTPSYLSQYLKRIAPGLRQVGINFVGRDRTSEQRSLVIEKLSWFVGMNPKKPST